MHSAPNFSSWKVSLEAWALERVTRIFLPKSGFMATLSNHAKSFLRFTTSPTRKIHGGLIASRLAISAASSRVLVHTCCFSLVPQRIMAIGVEAGLPFSMSFEVILGRFATPMRNTRVSVALANCGQLMSEVSLVGSSWPVITENDAATPRWVTGIPA